MVGGPNIPNCEVLESNSCFHVRDPTQNWPHTYITYIPYIYIYIHNNKCGSPSIFCGPNVCSEGSTGSECLERPGFGKQKWLVVEPYQWLVIYLVIIWILYGYYMDTIWILYGYYMVIIWLMMVNNILVGGGHLPL